MNEEGKVALLLGKGVEGICNRVMEDMGECVLYWPLSLLEKLDTVYSF